jgi:hypothetical protein
MNYRNYPELRDKIGIPPPLTAQNILGFDRSLAIRYEGKKLMQSGDLGKMAQASKRLAPWSSLKGHMWPWTL